MNEMYSVSPKSFSNATELAAVLNHFGFDKGRFLAALPKSFTRDLYDMSATLSTIEGQRVKTLVQRHSHAFLKLGLAYDGSKSWLDNVIQMLENNQLQGALTDEEINAELVYSIMDAIDDGLPPSSGTQDYATADNLIQYMRVILQTSQEIYIIDPYLGLGKPKYIKFLQKLVSQPECRDSTILVFSKKEHFETKEPFLSLANRNLSGYMVSGSSISFYPLDKNTDMHGRYVFNIHGGVTYDKGFQVDDATKVDFSVMSRGLHDSYFNTYNELAKSDIKCFTYRDNKLNM